MEIVEANRKLKNRKSPSEVGVSIEIMKHGWPKLWKENIVLIYLIFKSSKIPEEWEIKITIPIFKNEERGNPENYRGINLLNTHL